MLEQMQESLAADPILLPLKLLQENFVAFGDVLVHGFINYICSFMLLFITLDIMEADKVQTPLHCKLQFWYQHFIRGEDTFEDSLKPVATV
jgi:hypothetical protein